MRPIKILSINFDILTEILLLYNLFRKTKEKVSKKKANINSVKYKIGRTAPASVCLYGFA